MKNHWQAGFSLLEMTIVLIIIGIIAGAAMPSLLRYRHSSLISDTRQRQEALLQAVAGYSLAYGHLPCPADPSRPVDQRGLERPACNSWNTNIGIVPYRTLGLPESAAQDSYHRYMTYVVHPHSPGRLGADQTTRQDICRIERGSQPIQLLDQYNHPLTEPRQNQDFVAIVLISHGSHGHGAFTGNGQERLQVPGSGIEEQKNSDQSPVFYNIGYRIGDSPFRHIVKGITRNNLMAIYGHSPCHREHFHLSSPVFPEIN